MEPGAPRCHHRRGTSISAVRCSNAGAELVIWPEASTPFFFDAAGAARRADPPAGDRSRGRRFSSAPTRFERGRDAPADRYLQLRRARRHRRPVARDVSQDAAGAVRRVRAVQAVAVLRRAARRGREQTSPRATEPVVFDFDGRRVSVAICYESVYPWIVARVRAAGQPAARDDHQRRVVRHARRPRISTSNRAPFAPSRKAATSSAPPTPASAAPSIRTAVAAADAAVRDRADVVVDVRLLDGGTIYSQLGDVVVWLSLGCDRARSCCRSGGGLVAAAIIEGDA